jgi:tetratricopeptide (TPR) repeat protein
MATPRNSGAGQYDDRSVDARAVERTPNDALTYENLGMMEYRSGLFQEAVDDFTKAIEINPGHAPTYEKRAWAYYALKDYESAWDDVNSCRQLGGTPDPTLVDNLTKADSHSGQVDR